jgi:hypothetical protein
MKWSLAMILALGCTGCATLKPNFKLTYDIFNSDARMEFSLAPASAGKSVVAPEK